MEVFGITGTNGKTTTSYMLSHIIESNGEECALVGTCGHRIGKYIYEAVNTTPGKELFKKYLKNAEEQKIEKLVTEVSSHALVQGRLEGLNIKHGAFLNLSRDHLDYHSSMEEYYLAKRKLFDFKTMVSAIINIDDEFGKRLYRELNEEGRVETIGISMLSEDADFYIRTISESIAGTSFAIMAKEYGRREFAIKTPGRHNVYNATAATALYVASKGEAGFEGAEKALTTFGGAPGRFEIIEGRGVIGICDYAHTPDALEKLLLAVKRIIENEEASRRRRIITVFGCGGNRDKGKRPEMGRISGVLSDYVIVTSDNPRNEDEETIISEICEGMRDAQVDYETEPDRGLAIKRAVSISKEGDIVVVAGKGHENYQIVGNEKKHFDDRELLRELLK